MCFVFFSFQWQIGFVVSDHLIGFAPYNRLIGANRIFTILSNPIEGKSPTPIEPIYWRLLSYPIKPTPTHCVSTKYPPPTKNRGGVFIYPYCAKLPTISLICYCKYSYFYIYNHTYKTFFTQKIKLFCANVRYLKKKSYLCGLCLTKLIFYDYAKNEN